MHLSKKKRRTWLDKVVIVAAYVYPISGVPQLLFVLEGKVEGISVVSWLAFACFSVLFMSYGIAHKVKPMVVVNVLWLIIDLTIAFGTLAYRLTD